MQKRPTTAGSGCFVAASREEAGKQRRQIFLTKRMKKHDNAQFFWLGVTCPPEFILPLSRILMKRTYQPSVARRKKTHGFLVRMKTAGGRAVINARRAKGRARVAV